MADVWKVLLDRGFLTMTKNIRKMGILFSTVCITNEQMTLIWPWLRKRWKLLIKRWNRMKKIMNYIN